MSSSPRRFRRLRDHLQARWDGRRDGLRGIPAPHNSTTPPALLRIVQRATEELAKLSRTVVADEVRQRTALAIEERERRSAVGDVEQATKAVDDAGRRSKQITDRWETAAPGEHGPRVSKTVYLLGIVAILVAEFPLNAIAFRLFGEAEVLTWVMTASLAVTLVLCAHGLGTFLRQTERSMTERRWIAILVALPVLAIVAIAVIRARYLSYEAELTGFDALGPMVGSSVFLVINGLVYTGATMLSYLAHAPRDLAAERARTATADAERGLELAKRRLAEATRRVDEHEERFQNASVASEESFRIARARADEVIAYHKGVMATYCTANLRARKDAGAVDALSELPEIRMPAGFEDLGHGSRDDGDDGGHGNGKVSSATSDGLRRGVIGVAR